MDADRFDAACRLFGATGTRRRALSALLGGVIGLISLSEPDDAWAASGKCKHPCGACKSCARGKCVRTANGKRCKPGKCVSVRNGTRCPGGTCLGGRCAPFPTPPPPCRTLRQSCADDCCDGLVCDQNDCESANVCVRPLGQPCDGDDCNCSSLLQKCSAEDDTCRACVFPEERCQVADDCCICSNDDCACGTNAGGAENVCCFTAGSINCLTTAECCAGLECILNEDGFLQCVPEK